MKGSKEGLPDSQDVIVKRTVTVHGVRGKIIDVDLSRANLETRPLSNGEVRKLADEISGTVKKQFKHKRGNNGRSKSKYFRK